MDSEVLGVFRLSARGKLRSQSSWKTTLEIDGHLEPKVKILMAERGLSFKELMNGLLLTAVSSPDAIEESQQLRASINPEYLDTFLAIQADLDSIEDDAARGHTLRNVADLANFSAKMHRSRRR